MRTSVPSLKQFLKTAFKALQLKIHFLLQAFSNSYPFDYVHTTSAETQLLFKWAKHFIN